MESYITLEVGQNQSGHLHSVSDPEKYLPEVVRSFEPKFICVNDSPLPIEPCNSPEQRLIWGIRPRKFYALLALALLVVVGAIVGGVAGGLLSRKKELGKDDNAPHYDNTSPTEIGGTGFILANSSLAASSVVDKEGHTIRSVFFQDNSSAMILRQWDSQTTTWKTRNLADSLIRDTGRSSI